MSPEITRRRFLQAATGGAAWVALAGILGCSPDQRVRTSTSSAPASRQASSSQSLHTGRLRATATSARAGQVWSFRSRPDLHPPVITVTTPARDTAPGYVFIAPKNGAGEAGPGQDGCVILDNSGQPVWLRLLQDESLDIFNFRVQTYKGEKVLTWWVGHHTGVGQGEYVIADHSYKEITRVRASDGYAGDHHEFLITPKDTALITAYNKVRRNLTSVGGPVNGVVLDGIVQEIDIESGEVLFEWHSLDHVELARHRTRPYDHLHINSIDVYDRDHLLISSRATSTVFKLDRKTGEIVWRLGGKKSDFEMGPGARFAFQHDARRQKDGTITIFDNGKVRSGQSRGIVLDLDEDKMTATLVREYTHPDKIHSITQGNVQVLPNGNVFIGWGSAPVLSEFDHGGGLLFNAAFPTETESYRSFRFPWKGQPEDAPAVAIEAGPEDEVKIYASWNGATELASWQVLAGSDPGKLKSLGTVPRKCFETVITAHTTQPYIALKAMNSSDKVLGTTRTLKLEDNA